MVRKNDHAAVAASCFMVTHQENDYVEIFEYLENYFGKLKFQIVKSDMEQGLYNSVNKKMEFEKYGICRFHQTQIIRGLFRGVPSISALMYRKDRKQENFRTVIVV